MLSKLSVRLITLFALTAYPRVWAANYTVVVGGPGVLRFNPESVTAVPGDIVTFSFRQENHTVSQSTLDNPCELADSGFDSGFVPVAANNTDGPFPAAQFTVEDTNPVWVFCRQVNHCQQGMVFAINPGDQLSTFQANAVGNSTANSTSSTAASVSAPASTNTAVSSSAVSSASISSSSVASSASTSIASATSPVVVAAVTVTATVTVSETAAASSTASSTSSASPATSTSSDHLVLVGTNGQLTYEPSNITAEVGDTVTFQFVQGNHSVTQSSFSDPCVSLTKTSTTGEIGFDSGFMPVAANTSNIPTFTIQINDTSPIWAYCRQTTPKSHCGAGMVFSVNAAESGSNTFAAFEAKAEQTNGTINASTSSGISLRLVNRGACAVACVFGIVAGLFL